MLRAVALALRHGCYGDRQMAVGPNSSRMVKASSVFVDEVRVEDEKQKGMLFYGFVKPPELSVDRNWTILKHLFVDSYSHEGVSLWLNEGSVIWMEWEVVPHDGGNYKDMLMVVLKGEQNVKELERFHRMFSFSMSDVADGR
ncbi:uncharacterized protein A4U43_C03F21480 [Asparagus officinalis]|uniref:E3 ubiquitin-protein ligase APD1-4 N-terminal domain-containing protein n=1 Tax=Asparagus officinalis TaxID=4686 RepID=A0A5P1FDQ4_ASPOF|nr:uncharacterized protein A4U43_C03F21480 [Asparagus officinalis]